MPSGCDGSASCEAYPPPPARAPTTMYSGVSTFCGANNGAEVRALFDIYGNDEGLIAEEDAKSFFHATFKVRRPSVPVIVCVTPVFHVSMRRWYDNIEFWSDRVSTLGLRAWRVNS